MADGEALKLPKPLPGSDFLTFQADRRWDLLGFVKSDEIEEIKSCDVGQDGHRYYLIRWKDSWKPESSLIYCEKLLQDFWSRKSLLAQGNSLLKESEKTKTEVSTIVTKDVTVESLNNLATEHPSTSADKEEIVLKGTVENTMEKDASDDSEKLVETNVREEVVNFIVDNHISQQISEDSNEEVHATPPAEDKKSIAATREQEDYNIHPINSDDYQGAADTDNSSKANVDLSSDSPSKKGAPKRKARPPRQSVHSVNAKSSLLKKREKVRKAKERLKKIKAKGKGGKVSELMSTVIDPDVEAMEELSDDVDDVEKDLRADISSNLKCMVCDKHLSSEQNLMKHLLTHNNNHTCTICMKTFKSTHFLKHHMDKHNSSYQYSCPVCDKKFKFKNNMRGHLRKHNMEKKFECDICSKKFIGRYNLKEHMKAHSDNRPFACDFCKKAYKDRGALNKHLLTHQEKKVECEICKRPFTNIAQVKRHMQFHYSWPGDSFKRKSNLGADGEKLKYKCQFCEKTFNHYSNMNAHVHKKHKEKKIQCTECPKTFAYQYELREHMFIHLGGEGSKFKCQFCDKSFQRSTTLKNHERTTHLGIKRFKCDICGKLFGTKFNMKVHVEKLHTNNVEGDNNKTRRPRVNRNNDHREPELTNGAIPAPTDHMLPQIPVSVQQIHQHPLLRNISTSDIIRNAMSHIPELGYFPPLQTHATRGYQFYGMPPPDFGVS